MTNQTQQRTACDRCRNFKLRCERDDDTTQCRRCFKAQRHCHTSEANRPGRPPQTHKQSNRTDHARNLAEYLPTPSDTSTDISNGSDLGSNTAVESCFNPPNLNSRLLDQFFNDPEFRLSALQPEGLPHIGDKDIDRDEEMLRRTAYELASLHRDVLTDLNTIRGAKLAHECTSASSSGSSKGAEFIGRTLENANQFLKILSSFRPYVTPPVSMMMPLPHEHTIWDASATLPRCDVPTMFSVLSCYVCMTRICRIVLLTIHDSLLITPSITQNPLPPIFPDLHLGGFRLDADPRMQIKILIMIIEDYWNRINDKIGIARSASNNMGASILDPSTSSMVLQMIMKEAEEKPETGWEAGSQGTILEVISDIKGLIL